MEVNHADEGDDAPDQGSSRVAGVGSGRLRNVRFFGPALLVATVSVVAVLSFPHPHGADAAFTVRVTTPPIKASGPSPTQSPSPSASPSVSPTPTPSASSSAEPAVAPGENRGPDESDEGVERQRGGSSGEHGRPGEPGHADEPSGGGDRGGNEDPDATPHAPIEPSP